MQDLSSLEGQHHTIISSENEMFNRFLGNEGAVKGGVYFIYGPPGSSKSTICQWLLKTVKNNPSNEGLYFSNEQGAIAIAENARRIKLNTSFKISDAADISDIQKSVLESIAAEPNKQYWVVCDSLQGITDIANHPRKAGLDVHVALRLREFAEKNGVIIFLIGQVNKKGQFSGPNSVCHVIDVELTIATDSKFVRSLYVKKNRFGASNNSIRFNLENDAFEIMPEKGIFELDWSKKEDQALMPAPMRLLKENSIAGKVAQTVVREGTNTLKRTVINGIKSLFRGKKGRK